MAIVKRMVQGDRGYEHQAPRLYTKADAGREVDRLVRHEMAETNANYTEAFHRVVADPRNADVVAAYGRLA